MSNDVDVSESNTCKPSNLSERFWAWTIVLDENMSQNWMFLTDPQ